MSVKWNNITIKSATPYKTKPLLKKKDRIRVILDLPVEDYGELRKQIEAHHLLRNRRKGDTNED